MKARALLLYLSMVIAMSLSLPLHADSAEDDSQLKSWLTAELLGAMRWAKANSETTREKLDFSAAEILCYKRVQKQIEAGIIKRGTVFLIAERVRKKGVYRGEDLDMNRAEELRKTIIAGKIFSKLSD